jgi:hypothetical protein
MRLALCEIARSSLSISGIRATFIPVKRDASRRVNIAMNDGVVVPARFAGNMLLALAGIAFAMMAFAAGLSSRSIIGDSAENGASRFGQSVTGLA